MKTRMFKGKSIRMDDKDYDRVLEILADPVTKHDPVHENLKVEHDGKIKWLMAAVHEHNDFEVVRPKNGNPYDVREKNAVMIDVRRSASKILWEARHNG